MLSSLGPSIHLASATTIVEKPDPDYLRGRVAVVFMLSFVGLMPVAGLGITSVSDLIGMRSALAIAAVFYAVISLFVLARVRRQCSEPALSETPAPETPPVTAAV